MYWRVFWDRLFNLPLNVFGNQAVAPQNHGITFDPLTFLLYELFMVQYHHSCFTILEQIPVWMSVLMKFS